MQEQMSNQLQEAQSVAKLATISTNEMSGDTPIRLDFKNPVPRGANEYAKLKQIVKQQGLLNAQPMYYAYKIILTMGLLAGSITFLVVVNNFWLQLLNAIYLGFVFTQIGFLVHDTGHRQTFRTPLRNTISDLVMANLLLGVSYSWWVDRHNRHHGHPNQLDLDPDIDMPFLAFTNAPSQQLCLSSSRL
jgi:fatty acid desaturase